ncbi:hypothetical protein N1031_06995 [Herbiconiux moechotypicola]|uniref:DUF4177 domain-containing protein n=1 Tax=Herbiconiux moechotypicola TaxID=637393 RepID=A0ABN3DHI5_9MICO|nr:hypothetical protein [Herbiconiux moechotypicola]MCS5729503.1 hypothetical protein [Herbiconiux moechotypicola]
MTNEFPPVPTSAPSGLPADQLTAILNAEVAKYASQGWSVNSIAGGQAVLQRKKRIGWFWNLILCLITGGLWLIVVIIRVVNRKIETLILTVDSAGRVSAR